MTNGSDLRRLRPGHAASAGGLLLATAIVGMTVGPVSIDPLRVMVELLDHLPFVNVDSGLDPREAAIVWQLRAPRVMLGGLVGATLAVAGGAYQGVFRNPLADPFLLGVAAGAGLGATVAIVAGGSGAVVVPLAAFGGAVAAVAATWALGAAAGGRRSGVTLILAGVAVAAFFTAAQTFVQQRNADAIREVFSWLLGRLGTSGWSEVRWIFPYAAGTIVVMILYRRMLDVLAVGEGGGRHPGHRPGAGEAGRRVGGDSRHSSRCGRRGADRLRGNRGAAHRALAGGHVIPVDFAVVDPRRSGLSHPGGCRGANRPVARRASDRRGHSVRRWPIFRGRVADITTQRRTVTSLSSRALTVSYGGRVALHDVDLDVAAGEWVAIVGPNGAGKSTLLRALAGTVPIGGVVALGDQGLHELATRERARRIAMVAQHPVVPEAMLSLAYVLLGRTPHLGFWEMEKAADLRIARSALASLDADELEERPMGSLSGGERQRVVMARAITQQPEVLLLDEPTTSLDIGHQQQMLELVDRLRANKHLAVVSALHDLTLAAQYSDRLVMVDGGTVVAEGTAEEVLTAERLRRFSGASVTVIRDPVGGLIVVPTRQPT